MLWVGLTGGLGSGKSTVAGILRDLGYAVVDADALAHKALLQQGPGFSQVVQAFGPQVVGEDGSIDRRALGRIVFADPGKLSQLESIIHPLVRQMNQLEREKLEKSGAALAFYDVPLLFEKNLQDQFDFVVVVSASEENAISRAMRRDGLSRESILSRMAVQKPLSEKVRKADFVLINDGDVEQLRAQAKKMTQTLLTSPGPRKAKPK